jgi:hypothetical protein
MTRQIALYEEYKDTFPNVYKERFAIYIKAVLKKISIED